MGDFQDANWKICRPGPGLILMNEKSIPWILLSGRLPSMVNLHGTVHGARDGRDGILSVRLWPISIWVWVLIFMGVGLIWYFLIMKMKLPRQKLIQAVDLLPGIGCITVLLL